MAYRYNVIQFFSIVFNYIWVGLSWVFFSLLNQQIEPWRRNQMRDLLFPGLLRDVNETDTLDGRVRQEIIKR